MSADPLIALLDVLQPSLAMYLADSGLSTYPGASEIRLALGDLVSDHRSLIERASTVLEEREVAVPKAAYPLSFTGLHDVDLGHLLPRVTTDLHRQSREFERLGAVANDAAAASLAAEALRSARQHLDRLGLIATKLRAGLSVGQPSAAEAAAAATAS